MACFTVLGTVVLQLLGAKSIQPLLAAVGVCTLTGLFALAITSWMSRRHLFLPGVLLAMGCRLLPPLVACVWLAMHDRTPGGDLFVYSLLFAYLVSLATETWLSLKFISPTHSDAAAT